MEKTQSVWGGVAGKIIALLAVLAVVCGAVAASLAYAAYGKALLSSDDIKVISSNDNKDGTVSVKLRVTKSGCFLTDCKTERDGEKLVLKLYSSLRESDTYKADETGVYSLVFKVDKNMSRIVQEGQDGAEYTLVRINIDN